MNSVKVMQTIERGWFLLLVSFLVDAWVFYLYFWLTESSNEIFIYIKCSSLNKYFKTSTMKTNVLKKLNGLANFIEMW